MTIPGTLAAALSYLPSWWQETSDPAGLDALLIGWAKACGWKSAGFIWPAEGPAAVVKAAHAGGLLASSIPPEAAEVARRMRGGDAVVSWSNNGSGSKVYAAVMPAGRPMGLVWAERPAGIPWTEADRAYVALTAKTMERAPVVAAAIGPVIDADRLLQRLGDAAVIAGRMAHDFDNILTGIIGFADLTLPMLPVGSQPASYVAEISKVGHRGIQFTQQLHQLSRGGHAKPNPGSVAAALMKEETRLRTAMPAGVRIEKELPSNMPPVNLEAAPLQMLLGHLLANAVEASPPGGAVSVTVRPVELSEADAREFLGRAAVGAHLEIVIADTGPGIKPEVRRRLFVEPFYTTKVRHRGLGLAVAYRILCANRGGVRLEPVPSPATGTRARVVIPLAAARQTAASGAVAATIVGG